MNTQIVRVRVRVREWIVWGLIIVISVTACSTPKPAPDVPLPETFYGPGDVRVGATIQGHTILEVRNGWGGFQHINAGDFDQTWLTVEENGQVTYMRWMQDSAYWLDYSKEDYVYASQRATALAGKDWTKVRLGTMWGKPAQFSPSLGIPAREYFAMNGWDETVIAKTSHALEDYLLALRKQGVMIDITDSLWVQVVVDPKTGQVGVVDFENAVIDAKALSRGYPEFPEGPRSFSEKDYMRLVRTTGGDTLNWLRRTFGNPVMNTAAVEADAAGIRVIKNVTRGWPNLPGAKPVRVLSSADEVTYTVFLDDAGMAMLRTGEAAALMKAAGVPMPPPTALESTLSFSGKLFVVAGIVYMGFIVIDEVQDMRGYGDTVQIGGGTQNIHGEDFSIEMIEIPASAEQEADRWYDEGFGLSALFYRYPDARSLTDIGILLQKRGLGDCIVPRFDDPVTVSVPTLVADQDATTSIIICGDSFTIIIMDLGTNQAQRWENSNGVWVQKYGPQILSTRVTVFSGNKALSAPYSVEVVNDHIYYTPTWQNGGN